MVGALRAELTGHRTDYLILGRTRGRAKIHPLCLDLSVCVLTEKPNQSHLAISSRIQP